MTAQEALSDRARIEQDNPLDMELYKLAGALTHRNSRTGSNVHCRDATDNNRS